MRRRHFDALQPRCPLCRAALAISSEIRATDDDVLEGILLCTGDECRREYPIVDGIPILVGAIRAWLAANPLQLLLRDDLSPPMASLLGDVLGPNSPYDLLRQHTSIYAYDHYDANGGSAVRLIDEADVTRGDGPAIDTGCATGGTTFHLAAKTGALTLGVDLNFGMLRIGARVLRERRLLYARRRVGLAYDRVDEPRELPGAELVDFWCCDVAALPFADATFALATSVNVVDCTPAPRETLAELARVLAEDGTALIATPYDWTPTATPVEQWLGGHSQRSAQEGASEPILRSLLSGLQIERELERVPWRLRLHDRSAVDYDVHVIVARRRKARRRK